MNSKLSFKNQFLKSCLPQQLPFSKPIMKYIWTNPFSPKVYLKLIRCCKLFFIKNQIFIVGNLTCQENGDWICWDGKEAFQFGCRMHNKKHIKIDIENLQNKIWLTGELCINENYFEDAVSVASNLVPQILKCSVEVLILWNQNLSYDELKFLSTVVKKCRLVCSIIRYDNGKQVPLENIVQLFLKCTDFFMNFATTSGNAACKNYDTFIKACSTIKEVGLSNIPADFNIQTFYNNLKKSKCRTLFEISSHDEIDRISTVFEEILATETFEFIPPVIYSLDQPDREKNKKMKKIQKMQAEKLS